MAVFPTPPARVWLDEIRERNAQANRRRSEFREHVAGPGQVEEVQLTHLALDERSDPALRNKGERIVCTPQGAFGVGHTEAVALHEFRQGTLAARPAQVGLHLCRPFGRMHHKSAQRLGPAVTARKDDAPAADQAAITNVVGLMVFSGVGGLIQTTSG